MQNCSFYNGTRLIIKKDGALDIVEFLVADKIKKVLLLTGKTAVKKIGLYDKLTAALTTAGIDYVACDEVRANPEIKTVVKCVDLCRNNSVEAVLAVGGGSVYDSGKAIIVGAKMPENEKAETVWEYYEGTRIATEALPLYGVLTISATATEHNSGGVVQDDEEKKKWSFGAECCFPKVSIIDPTLEVCLPWYEEVNGFVDSMVHILEFLTNVDDPDEHETAYEYDLSLLRSIIKCGDKLQKDQNDYDARANFCWAAALALDGFSGFSFNGGCWAVHYLEHAMGAINPSISHGAGLGVAFPAFVKVNTKRGLRQKTYARIAKEVFGKEGSEGLIEGFEDMLKRWGHPTTLDQLFGKKMGDADRKELLEVYMQRPICGYMKDGQLPREMAEEAYTLM